jgi:hypothetical protein
VPNLAITGPVSVTSGGTGTSPTNFKVKPKIVSFSPTSGSMGTTVIITGKTFTGTTKVLFTSASGTVMATFTVDSYTQITCTVPSGAITGRIFVVNPGGKAKSKTDFTVI